MKKKVSFGQSILSGVLAAAVSAVINSILFYIYHAAGIITDNVEIQPGQHMTVVNVLVASIIPSIAGSLVFFALERLTRQGYRRYLVVSIILLLLSFGNAFMAIKDVPLGYAISLNTMHVVVFASLLFFLKRAVKKVSAAA